MAKVTRAQLVAAAAELNEEFGLEPEIKTSKVIKDAVIITGIQKAAVMYDPANDELTPETLAVIEALTSADETPEPVKKGATPEPPAEEPELTEAQIEMLEELKNTKKRDDLVELMEDVMFDDVREALEGEKNPIKLKSALKKAVLGESVTPVEKPKATAKAAKKAPNKSRVEAAAITVQGHAGKTVSMTDLIEEADEAYGKPNEQESKWAIRMAVKVLGAVGLVTVDGENVTVGNM